MKIINKMLHEKFVFLGPRILRKQGPPKCRCLFANRYGFIPEDWVQV